MRRGVLMENPFPTAIHGGRSRHPWLPIEALVGGKSGQQRGRGDTSALCALPIAWGFVMGFGAIDALRSNRRAWVQSTCFAAIDKLGGLPIDVPWGLPMGGLWELGAWML